MSIWQGDKGRKKTGGKRTLYRKKRKYELGGYATHTVLGKTKSKTVRTKGGLMKRKAVSLQYANVYNPADKSTKKIKILSIERNEANPHYVRRGILTKGSVVKTELGMVRITSRPSQIGIANGVVLEKEKS